MMRFPACLALLLAASLAVADEAALGPQPGVLLLRNGSVLKGNILRSGNRYEVSVEDGDMRVRADDVAFVGDTLEACYEFQRQAITFDRVEDHLDLAEWCLRQGLIAEGGMQLRDALASDPTHPRCALVERRLRLAIEVPAEPVELESLPADAPSIEELDRMVRTMPPGTVETYTNTIQPLLLNQCSTAGCHGPSTKNELRLMRMGASRTHSRRATQRNLHSVLQQIRHDRPDESPLLVVPLSPHGPNQTAMFSSRQANQYRQIVEWVYAVSNKTNPKSAAAARGADDEWPATPSAKNSRSRKANASATESGDDTSSPTVAARVMQHAEQARQAGFVETDDPFAKIISEAVLPGADRNDELEPGAETAGEGRPARIPRLSTGSVGRTARPGDRPHRSPPKRGELPEDKQPVDEFDAEQFNKQFGT